MSFRVGQKNCNFYRIDISHQSKILLGCYILLFDFVFHHQVKQLKVELEEAQKEYVRVLDEMLCL